MFDKKTYMKNYKRKPILISCHICLNQFSAMKKKQKYCSKACFSKANSEMQKRLWAGGKGNGFKIGHKAFLKKHIKQSKEWMSIMQKERMQNYGQHPNSMASRFKEGDGRRRAFKGMHSYVGRLKLARIHLGARNPMYGKPINQAVIKGLKNKLAEYGLTTLKGAHGIPWIDYEFNSQYSKGLPAKARGFSLIDEINWGILSQHYKRRAAGKSKIGRLWHNKELTKEQMRNAWGKPEDPTKKGIEVHIKGKSMILEA